MKNLISNNILITAKENSNISTGDFFKSYSKVAGSIKKMKKMKGEKLERAMKPLVKAVEGMQELKKILG